MTTQFLRREVALSELRISALERVQDDDASKPPILLLHGLVAEADTFRSLMAQRPQDRRVIALDLPGAGYSDRHMQRSAGFRGMAEIVREAADQLALEKPVIIGHSHGGALALQIATRDPIWINSLILLCPAHPFSGREDALVSFYLSSLGRTFAHLLPRLPDWLHLLAFRRMPGSRRDLTFRDLAPYLHTLRTPGTVDHLLRLLKSWKMDMDSLGQELMACPLAAPTLLLWGDKDMVVPIASAKLLTQHMTKWEMFTLRGVGHLPNEEAPQECADLIKTWLNWRDTHWKYQESVLNGGQPEGI